MTAAANMAHTHTNYVIEFSDGESKIGVTSRPIERMAELIRYKAKLDASHPTRRMLTPPSTRAVAYKTEKNICSLLSYMNRPGSREWFGPTHIHGSEFHYLEQTTGMFWGMNNDPGRVLCAPVEVLV